MRLNLLFLFVFLPFLVFAQTPDDADSRLLKLSSELRCLVCQNQSIADSDADLATDLKNEIRVMIQTGKTDAQILDFMTERYGDFVRYNPPVKTNTLILWVAPAVFFAIGFIAFLLYFKKRNQCIAATTPDSKALQKAAELLEKGDE